MADDRDHEDNEELESIESVGPEDGELDIDEPVRLPKRRASADERPQPGADSTDKTFRPSFRLSDNCFQAVVVVVCVPIGMIAGLFLGGLGGLLLGLLVALLGGLLISGICLMVYRAIAARDEDRS
jgi:hypothetical protein